MKKNSIFEVINYVYNHKKTHRVVITFRNNDELLIDFTDGGEPFEDGTACVWARTRFDKPFASTNGTFADVIDAYNFAMLMGGQSDVTSIYADCF